VAIVEGLIGSYAIFYIFLNSKKIVIKEKLAWVGQYTLEIYTIHFHFAKKILNPGELHFGLYSFEGIIFVIVAFVAMSITTAMLIYMVNQVPIMKLLMFGKQSKKPKNVK
jgi:peptidoglycan/LPS O-acetylase OafA/YrhL